MNERRKFLVLSGDQTKINLNRSLIVQGAILMILFFWLFGSSLSPLFNDWFQFKSFSHGLLVPLIAGYMTWQKRDDLHGAPIYASAWGVLLIVPALAAALVGKAIGDTFTERVGMVLCLNGFVLLLL